MVESLELEAEIGVGKEIGIPSDEKVTAIPVGINMNRRIAEDAAGIYERMIGAITAPETTAGGSDAVRANRLTLEATLTSDLAGDESVYLVARIDMGRAESCCTIQAHNLCIGLAFSMPFWPARLYQPVHAFLARWGREDLNHLSLSR